MDAVHVDDDRQTTTTWSVTMTGQQFLMNAWLRFTNEHNDSWLMLLNSTKHDSRCCCCCCWYFVTMEDMMSTTFCWLPSLQTKKKNPNSPFLLHSMTNRGSVRPEGSNASIWLTDWLSMSSVCRFVYCYFCNDQWIHEISILTNRSSLFFLFFVWLFVTKFSIRGVRK